ncbi:MAG: hypothetical protein JOZ96_10210 [Acidobacteria bacterium]|nr:hypothetical protein [Acidobacteriota bacterium]
MAHGKFRRDSIHETPDVSYITNPDVAHEESDVAVRPLLWFVGGLTFFTIIVCLSMYLMFQFFKGREESQELAASPLARQGDERLPPEPRLQLAPRWSVEVDGHRRDLSYGTQSNYVPQPWSEYLLVNEQWQRELKNYGWADEQAGTARIPVERAIDLYLERHAKPQPASPQGPAPAAGPQPANPAPKEQTPAESSSGQQPEQKHQ